MENPRHSDPTFTNAESKLGYHPEIVNSLLQEESVIPVSMEVDISYFCGDQCTYCHFSYTHQRPVKPDVTPIEVLERVFMTPDLARTVFRKMADAGVKSIVFSGGGEPTDSPFALEIFKLAKSYGLELGMYTRGYNLKGELAQFVAKNFEWIVLSLDVTNPEDHKDVKGTNEKIFARKVGNIVDFIEAPGRLANISVSMMVDKGHLKETSPYSGQEEFFDQAKITRLERDMLWLLSLGADEVQIRPIVDVGTYKEQRETGHMAGLAFLTDIEVWQNHYAWIPEIVEILEKYANIPGLNTSIDKFRQLFEGANGDGVCYGMVISAGLVSANGTVYKCVNTRGIPEKVIGDLRTQTMEQIFLSGNLDRSVDSFCRVGCRGCKVNEVFSKLKSSNGQLPSLLAGVKHPNFI